MKIVMTSFMDGVVPGLWTHPGISFADVLCLLDFLLISTTIHTGIFFKRNFYIVYISLVTVV